MRLAIAVGWLWVMGTPLWVAVVFITLALLIFVGLSRIVAESGLAVLRSPMPAPDLVVQGLGSSLIEPTGVLNLSISYIWSADLRVFLMGTWTNGLKLMDEMAPQSRRAVFRGVILALFLGILGSFWMIFHLGYHHGGVNLSGWFF